MTRFGEKIWEIPLRHRVNSGIKTGAEFDELAACIESNLDPYKWMEGGYSREFKEMIIAHYSLSNLVEAHSQDAQATEAERASKKRGR